MRILVLEDEALVAMDLADQLSAAGHEVVGPASTIEQGLSLIDERAIDCAIIDANVHGASPRAIVERLSAHRVPFLYVSGYPAATLDSDLPPAEHLRKPIDVASLLHRLDGFDRTPR